MPTGDKSQNERDRDARRKREARARNRTPIQQETMNNQIAKAKAKAEELNEIGETTQAKFNTIGRRSDRYPLIVQQAFQAAHFKLYIKEEKEFIVPFDSIAARNKFRVQCYQYRKQLEKELHHYDDKRRYEIRQYQGLILREHGTAIRFVVGDNDPMFDSAKGPVNEAIFEMEQYMVEQKRAEMNKPQVTVNVESSDTGMFQQEDTYTVPETSTETALGTRKGELIFTSKGWKHEDSIQAQMTLKQIKDDGDE